MKKDVIILLISIFIFINVVIITAAVTDVNDDGVTDRKDISDLVPYYRGVYNSDFDVNSDGVVDLFDIVIIAKNVTLSDGSNATIYIFHDFEDGTIGNFTNPWGNQIDFIDDPTPRSQGKVTRIFYSTSSSQERALQYLHASQITYDTEIWVKGSFYLPSGSGNSNNRKLFDYQGNGVRMTLHAQGTDLKFSFVDSSGDGTTNVEIDAGFTGITINKDTWYTVEVKMVTNSAGNKDGQVEIYMNGSTTANWTYDQSPGVEWIHTGSGGTYFQNFLTGFQLSSAGPFSEERYWDDITYSDLRI